jgi:hypothetical protein
MKKLAMLLAASLIFGSALASTSPAPTKKVDHGGRHWVINVGLFLPTDDHDDMGVDTGFMASADYHFGAMGDGTSNSSWFAGLGAFFGQGSNDFDSTAYGIHLGVLFGFGQPGEDNPWGLELKGGIYRVNLDGGSPAVDDDKTGFGGSIAVTYQTRSASGNGMRFSLGWYSLPEVANVDHRGWFFAVGFPVG